MATLFGESYSENIETLREILQLKVCILANDQEKMGGQERVVSQVATLIAEKHDVTICCVSNTYDKSYYELPKSVVIEPLRNCERKRNLWAAIRKITRILKLPQTFYITWRSFYSAKRVKKIANYLNDHSFDIVIGAANVNSLLLASIDRKKLNNSEVKLIGWQHNTYEAYFLTKDAYSYGQDIVVKRIMKNLDYNVVLTRKDAVKWADEAGIQSACIYNPLSFVSESLPDFKNKTLIFVGRLIERQKGLDLLIEISKIIFSNPISKNWKLVIVGDGDDRGKFETDIRNAGLEKKITCVGSQRNVAEYYLKSDIMLLTSRWEGFGLVVTEAFECGIPVVSFHNNGPDEIITDGVNGYLVDQFDTELFAQRVIDIMKDDELKKSMSVQAKKRSKDFSAETIRDQWMEIIED